jgi:hypothetical protein
MAASASSSNTATTAPAELCVSVTPSQSSIKRGQTATYTVQVSTRNGSASGVSVALTAQPSSQKPAFSSGCAKGDGTASCSVGSMTSGQLVSMDAQIPVAASATSVSSVALTATASAVTSTKWTPPAAAATTSVTAASAKSSAKKSAKTSAKASAKKSAKGSASGEASRMVVLPLGPIPALNGESSTLIGPGNASGLFPTIGLSPTASPQPTAATQPGQQNTTPDADASPVSLGTPVFTAQVAGLIVLGLAIMLTAIRLSLRKRPGKPHN